MKNKREVSSSFISKLTEDVSGNMTFIELHSNKELTVSGCKGVMEYDSSALVIDTISGVVRVCGKGLFLSCFQGDTLIVYGKILSVCLEDYD